MAYRIFVILLAVFCTMMLFACADDDPSTSSGQADDDTIPVSDDDADDDIVDDDTTPVSDDDADDDIVDDDAIDDDTSGDDDTTDDDTSDDDTSDDDTTDCLPPGGGPLAQLQAGVAARDFYAPIGLSLGGFGMRPGPTHPLANKLGAAFGRYDKLNVKALTLDNGMDRLVIVRIPLCFPVDMLYALVLDAVCERAGVDLTEKLWLSASHTHSGPARFYPVPDVFALSGVDSYYQPAVDGMVDAIASAVIDSMNALEPAALATGLDDNYDPENRVSFDRRCQDDPPESKENRLLVTRIDRADGSPLAVLLGLAVHGTMFNETHYTGDAPAYIEYMLQERFAEPVEVLMLNTSAGDQAPNYWAGNNHGKLARMEVIGGTVAGKALAVYDQLTPSRDVEFEMVAKRIPISRLEIGYEPGEFGWYNTETGVWHDFTEGALYCGEDSWPEYNSIVDCDTPETTLVDGYLRCYAPLAIFPEDWILMFKQTQIAAIKLQDDILLLFPGELTSKLAQYAIAEAATLYSLPEEHVHAFGYSNDYQWYLQLSDDWMQGGYETSASMWGPKFARWLADRANELVGQLFTPEDEDNVTGAPLPVLHSDDWPPPVDPEQSDRDPQMLTEPSAAYRRFETVTVQWSGGFTGIDDPQIAVEVLDGDEFVPAILPTGRAFDDRDFRTILEYAPSPDYDELAYPAQRLHQWTFFWEITVDVPEGVYRLHISGNSWNGWWATPYELTSEQFTVATTDNLIADDLQVEQLSGGIYEISCTAAYAAIPGNYRLLDAACNPSEPCPLKSGTATVSIAVEGGTPETCTLIYDALSERFVGEFTQSQPGLPHAATLAVGALQDDWENLNGNELGPVNF